MDKKISIKQYYILSFTWGIIMTLMGVIVSIALIITKHKPKRNQYGWYFELKPGHSGLSLGPAAFVNKGAESVLPHEFGHSVQNCFYGPFMLVVTAWSAARFWFREYLVAFRHKKYSDLPPYDSIWFEGLATKLGNFYKSN